MLDNHHTHKHNDIDRWLARNSRITLDFTPTSGSWMNFVEVFSVTITRRAIRRAPSTVPPGPVAAIHAFIDVYSTRCRLLVWTKTAYPIQPHATRKPTSDAGH